MNSLLTRRVLFLTVMALLVLAVSSALMAKPKSLNRADIEDKYKWNLADIYADWTTWEADFKVLEGKMDEMAAMQGSLKQGPQQLLKAYQVSDELGMLLYKVYRYPQLTRDLDTRDNEVGAKMQQIQILYAKFGVATSWFSPEILSIPWETMEKWLADTKELVPYAYSIRSLYRQQKHVLDEEKEKLLSYFSPFNATPEAAFEELSVSDIKFPEITLSNGETTKLTPGNYYNILSLNRNQADRAKAFEAYYSVYDANANTYAAIYNGILQRDWALAQARNYGSTLEAALDGDNVPAEVFQNLVKTVKAGTAPVKRYNQLRKKALGLETYHLYDGSIPIAEDTHVYNYDDVQSWIIESVKPLGKTYQQTMAQAFANRWMDVYENEGKVPGAYSAGVYGVHPFLLLNYNETLESVFTLGHELGHCMHTMLSYETQPFATADYTIFVAEVASTLNEALLLDYMLNRTNDPKERVALLQQAIENITGTFYTQVMFADFEWQAHKLVEEGQPVTAQTLKELYGGLIKEYHGESVELDSLYQATWTRISHFYGSPYYVYKYATCFASSAKIVKDITSKDKKVNGPATERYLTLLRSGGSDDPMELLKKAGVDLSQPATIQAVVDQLDELVTRLEKEMAKL